MARLYANENFPLPVVEELRRLGHDVLTTQETDQAGKSTPDDAVLQFATAKGRILSTFNRKHFVHLHSKTKAHDGIIVCSFDPNFAALPTRIHAELISPATLKGKPIRINRPST